MNRAGALAATLALAAGCETLVGIHDKTYDGGTDASGATDVGAGDVSEAGGGADDGGAAVDGNDGQYPDLPCSQQPSGFFFCADFDEVDDAGYGWSYPFTEMSATIGLSDEYYRSKPRSGQVYAPPTMGSQAQLGLNVTATQSLTVAFDLRVDVDDQTKLPPQVGVMQVVPGSGSGRSIIYALGSQGAQIIVYDGTGAMTAGGTTPPPGRTWTRLVFVYDATKGLTAFEDGQMLTGAPSLTGALSGMVQVIFGADFVYDPSAGNEAFQAELDNIVVWNN
jgi:hypothetical protein